MAFHMRYTPGFLSMLYFWNDPDEDAGKAIIIDFLSGDFPKPTFHHQRRGTIQDFLKRNTDLIMEQKV